MKRRTPSVGISGSYGGLNLGDEAILEAMVAELRRAMPVEITVFSRDAEDTRKRHRVDHAVPVRELSRTAARKIVAELDLFILGGGGLLFDGEAETYLREVLLAHEVGTPVMIYAISAGPLHDARTRDRVREALDAAAVITVRDRHTRALLEDVGVRSEILLTADPALLLAPAPLEVDDTLRAEALDPSARMVGFSVREPGPAAPWLQVDHYHRLLANAADFIVSRLDAEIVFVPLERRRYDVQHSHGVIGHMRHALRATVLRGDYAPNQLATLLGHFSFCVGMRLHFLVFSAIAGVPFVAVPYASKVSSFLEDLNQPTPPLEQLGAGELIAAIDRAWDERAERRTSMQRALEELRSRARINTELVVRLLRKRRL